MRIHRTVLAGLIVTLVPFKLHAAAPTFTADTVYREALLQETTSRDLPKAIELYQKVLQQPDASRELQANAYLRLGICHRTLGQAQEARQSWTKVVQDFADQQEIYQEAKRHLQEMTAEQSLVQVQTSTPTLIYAIPRTRGEFRIGGVGYSSVSGVILSYPSLAYFYRANRAIGLEGSWMGSKTAYKNQTEIGSNGDPFQPAVDIESMYFAVVHQWEKPIGNQLRPYFKTGPAAYRFHAFDTFTQTTQTPEGITTIGGQEETKWAPGAVAEAGVTIGWSRGFIFTLGYGLNVFYQPALMGVVGSSFRGIPGLRFTLGYRW